MDEIGLLLERVADSQTGHDDLPSPNVIIEASRRRTAIRTAASSALVVTMIVAFVFALAGVGLASESVHPAKQLAVSTVMSR